MHIDEYIKMHPEKLPEGFDLMEFSTKCEEYINDCRNLVPYNSSTYMEDVFDMCITAAQQDDDNIDAAWCYFDEDF